MRPGSALLRSTTFRMALSYLAIFTVSAIALLGLVSWSTSMFIEWQIQETVEAEANGLAETLKAGGIEGLAELIGQRTRQDMERRVIYMLSAPDGQRVAGNLYGWPEAGDRRGWMRFSIERMSDDRFDTDVLAHGYELPGGYHLLVGRSLYEAKRVKLAINRALAWGLALTVLLGIVGGYLTSRHLIQRVDAMGRTARRVIGGDMSSRMGLTGAEDEFDQLAAGFNDMMDEIERLMQGIRTVTDNVAHDLRTPLNRLRARIELTLLTPGDADTYRRALEETVAEIEHMLATFNALLTISHAESGRRRAEPVDPARLVEDVAELYEPVAEEKGVTLVHGASPGLTVAGDRHLLFQALANLVDNAVKYTPPGGRVEVTALAGDGGPVLSVADSGPGIPESERTRVLDRFVRLDATRSTPGNGLGLSLVQAVARQHGARLTLADNGPGLTVRLEFGG